MCDRIVTQGLRDDLSDSALSPACSGFGEGSDIGDSASAVGEEKTVWTGPVPLKTKKLVGIPKYITDDFEICLQLESDAGELS